MYVLANLLLENKVHFTSRFFCSFLCVSVYAPPPPPPHIQSSSVFLYNSLLFFSVSVYLSVSFVKYLFRILSLSLSLSLSLLTPLCLSPPPPPPLSRPYLCLCLSLLPAWRYTGTEKKIIKKINKIKQNKSSSF